MALTLHPKVWEPERQRAVLLTAPPFAKGLADSSLLLSPGGLVSFSVFFLSSFWLIPLLPIADSFFLDLLLKPYVRALAHVPGPTYLAHTPVQCPPAS